MLQIKNITKIYKTGDLVQQALKNVSLNLRDNEFVAILGPSGSGKTTLLNIIGGLDKYDDGDLIIDNVSTKDYKDKDWDSYRNHTIGFVFQSYNLIPHQTVLRNVELALTIAGISANERKQRALKALEEVGLADQAHKKPNQMSGGQMQRVAIARALVNNPKILLADEPTGALDSQTSIQVMELLKEVAKDRLVVMVTHNPELAKEYANRIVNLKDGEIVGDSNPYILEEGKLEKPQNKNLGKAHMSFFTALSLSFNNLLTKKGRTILTAFAGSIGIIGIALILSLSQGFQNYIDKIQEDTMSSYPLTVQKETANIFSALLSTSIESKEDIPEGKVKEVMLISSMMNSIGANDLKSFKHWLESNEDLYINDVNDIKYSYSISPRIYTKDATKTITQLNPSTLMSSIYSDSMASAFTSFSSSTASGVFSQVDFDSLQEKYVLIKGNYPSKYNEVLLVLPKENQISDLLVYMLGLRDTKELKTLIGQVMNKETVTINNNPLTLTYDDLMNVELKLVDVSDLYKYNSNYSTYEDMSEDTEYMEKVYKDAERLIITGVAYSTDDMSTGGILYSEELTDYVIDKASSSSIVRKQLNNKDVDVFSGNKFDSNEDKKELNFDDFVSIDEEAIKSAFKVNINQDSFKVDTISEEEMTNIILEASKKTAKEVAKTDTMELANAFNAINSIVLMSATSAYENTYVSEDGLLLKTLDLSQVDNFKDSINGNFYKECLTNLLNSDALGQLQEIFGSFEQSQDMTGSLDQFQQILNIFDDDNYETLGKAVQEMFTLYYQTVREETELSDNQTTVNYGSIELSGVEIAVYTNPNNLIKAVQSISILTNLSSPEAITLTSKVMLEIGSIQVIAMELGTTSAKMMEPLIESFSKIKDVFGKDIMTIDMDKFAEAFKFDMNSDEVSRLMTSMLTSSTASYSNNLINLGYQDKDDPSSISFYFKNFDTKERFLEVLKNYNNTVDDEEKEISYTDITGLLMGSVKKIIDSVSYVLIAFVSVSLIVSSIMIAVITLISVMERTKEIGILRAMGASKHNVSSIFNAETFIIGLLSGLLGVGFTYAVIPPINSIIHNLTDNYNINAVLPMKYAIILVLISVVLTMVAGLIPSRKAAKQDPVTALRTE